MNELFVSFSIAFKRSYSFLGIVTVSMCCSTELLFIGVSAYIPDLYQLYWLVSPSLSFVVGW